MRQALVILGILLSLSLSAQIDSLPTETIEMAEDAESFAKWSATYYSYSPLKDKWTHKKTRKRYTGKQLWFIWYKEEYGCFLTDFDNN